MMMSFIRSIIFVVLFAVPNIAFAQTNEQDEGERFKAATESGNYAEAYKILLPYAESGNANSQFLIGVYTSKGQGVTASEADAIEWFRKAAEQGHVKGQLAMAVRYKRGEGVEQSYSQAAFWLEKAAAQGNADGQFFLADLLYKGKGVPQDRERAIALWKQARDGGEAMAGKILEKLGQ
ncbi:MAG: tetratricopeptide repeat protein [Alphaproteobacteria bacterium]